MNSFTTIPKFKFWCQKILPLVYDDSLSYMELLCKVIDYLNKVIEDINNIPDYINSMVSDEKLKEILSELLDELREQIARANEGENTTASFNRDVDELVWLNGKLVRMTRAILAGDRYVEDDGTPDVTGNFIYTSVEIELQRVKDSLSNEINARQQADTQLQNNINDERTARQQADTQLQNNINNETTARQQADTQLQNNINNEATARQQADTQLQNNINNEATVRQQEIRNRKLGTALYIGNSYLGGVGSSSGTNGIKRLTEDMFYASYSKSGSGTGFMSYTDHNTTYYDLIQEAGDELSSDIKTAITHVIFLSAMGDSRYVHENVNNGVYPNFENFHIRLRECSNYIKENFPNAKMYVMFCDIVLNDSVNYADSTLRDNYWVHQAFKMGSSRCGFTYLGWASWLCTHRVGYNDSDNYHPNDDGYRILSNHFRNSISNGCEYPIRYFKTNVTQNGVTVGEVIFRGTPDTITIAFNQTSEITVDSTSYIVLFNMSNTGLYPFTEMPIRTPIRKSDNTIIFGMLLFTNGQVKLSAGAGVVLNQYGSMPTIVVENGFNIA